MGASVAFRGENGKTIDITSIDKFVSDNKIEHVDFINMDIEGAELFSTQRSSGDDKEIKAQTCNMCVL